MDDALVGLTVVSLVGLAVVVSGLLAVYSWSRIDHPVSESYATLMAVDSLWAGGYLLMILGAGGLLTEFGLGIKALFAALAGVAWLRFVSEYTGDSEWIPGWVWWVLAAQAVLYGLVVAINPGGLAISEVVVGQLGVVTFSVEQAGLLTVLQLAVSACTVGVSLFFLGRFFIETRSVYRYQAALIFVIGVLVTVSSILFVGQFRVHPLVDPTPILFNLQALGVGWALYRYDFLRLSPVVVTRFFREMTDPVLIINAEFVIADFNETADALIDGLESQMPIGEINDTAFSRTLQTTISGGDADEFTTLVTDGGRSQTYDIEETEVTDQFGITQGYVIVLRDITERKRRERRLRNQNERLSEFADIVSHDLRNPLSTAIGWNEFVDQQLDETEPDIEAIQDGVTRISNSHERMDELIEMLLTMARQGQTVVDPEVVSLEAVAKAAWSTADTGNLKLVVETDRSVEGDPTRIKSVFENLFRNVNDHAAATTVYIAATENGFVIEDDGDGIPKADRAELFEFGYTTDQDGTGIGLAVVKRICEAHDWEITVDDSDHGGTRFAITDV